MTKRKSERETGAVTATAQSIGWRHRHGPMRARCFSGGGATGRNHHVLRQEAEHSLTVRRTMSISRGVTVVGVNNEQHRFRTTFNGSRLPAIAKCSVPQVAVLQDFPPTKIDRWVKWRETTNWARNGMSTNKTPARWWMLCRWKVIFFSCVVHKTYLFLTTPHYNF